MRIRISVGLLLVGLMLLAAGCTTPAGVETPPPVSESSFEIVTAADLQDQDVLDWYNDHYREKGQHQYFDEVDGQHTYLLISYGERPTAGYQVDLVDMAEEASRMVFTVVLTPPAPDTEVAQVVTWPHILFEVTPAQGVDLIGLAETTAPLSYEGVTARYNGQIDNGSIEVTLDETSEFFKSAPVPGSIMAMRLEGEALEGVTTFNEGDEILFDCYVNDNGQFVITTFREVEGHVLTHVAKGVLTGRIDPSFVEIYIDGTYREYLFYQEWEETIGSVEDFTAVDLEYILNEQDQRQILSIKAASPAGIGNAPETEGMGRVDTVFKPDAFLVDGTLFFQAYELLTLSSKRIQEEDYITFTFYVDGYGRRVITSYDAAAEVKTDTGRFERLAGETLYIKVSGVPDEIAAKAFATSELTRNLVDSLSLSEGDPVKYQYIARDGAPNRIIFIEWLD